MPSDRKRLYLLGAGASAADPYKLPTLGHLLQRVADYVSKSERQILEQAAYEALGAENLEEAHSFEIFLSRLGLANVLSDSELARIPELRRRAAHIAVDGLQKLFSELTNEVADALGPYDRLVSSLRRGDAIVSFNWDVLLEVAFRRASRQFTYLPSGPLENKLLLLRPHGCLCWFALLESEMLCIDSKANVEVLGGLGHYYMLYLKNPLLPLDMGRSNRCAKQAVSKLPAIVFPLVPEQLSVGGSPKDGWAYQGHQHLVKETTRAFVDLVRVTSEIVVIGYSLPGTDVSVIDVLKEFARNPDTDKRPRRLLVVDKNQRVTERFRRLVDPDAQLVCQDFSAFDPSTV